MQIVLTGIMLKKNEVKRISDTLSVLDFIMLIDEDTKYPQKLMITATNDKIDEVKVIPIGRKCDAKVYVRGKEKNGSYFNSFNLYAIKPTEEEA